MAAVKRAGRQRNQLPHCYYEGFVEKRSFKDKTPRRLWTCLCGKSLFFFNNNKDNDYVEKLDLDGFISMTDDGSWDRNLDAARIILRLKDGDIRFTVPSLEARELWKGFIYSVVQLSVPSSLNLLPGQLHMLKETVDREKDRLKKLSPPVVPASASSSNLYLSLEGDMPVCFRQVSRMEAEIMLERQAERGNLLLRPGRDGTSFAATTRQDLNGSVFRHYRVTRKYEGGFAIDLERPIPCATLDDVVHCLVQKTGGALTPLVMEEGTYEESITFVQSNEENGESVQCAALSNPAPTPPPKPVLRVCPPYQLPEADERLYLNDTLEKEEEGLQGLERKKALMPPTAAPRLSKSSPPPSTSSTQPSSSSSTQPSSSPSISTSTSPGDVVDGRKKRLTMALLSPDPLAQTIAEELRLKLEKRRALQ